MAKTVKATWVGPFEAELSDGTHCVPGETVVEIGAAEAEASDHWETKGSGKKSADVAAPELDTKGDK